MNTRSQAGSINHLEKLFVTNDAATIIRELEVSSKILVVKQYSCSFYFFILFFLLILDG